MIITAKAKEIMKSKWKNIYKLTDQQIIEKIQKQIKGHRLISINGKSYSQYGNIEYIDAEIIKTDQNIFSLIDMLNFKRRVKVTVKEGDLIKINNLEDIRKDKSVTLYNIETIINKVMLVVNKNTAYDYNICTTDAETIKVTDGNKVYKIPTWIYTKYKGDPEKWKFEQMCDRLMGQILSNRNEILNENVSLFVQKQNEMFEIGRKIEDIKNIIKKTNVDTIMEQFVKQIDKLNKYPKIEKAGIKDLQFEIKTNPLFIDVSGKGKLPIGSYLITIDLLNNKIVVYNTSIEMDGNNYPHPHISRLGDPCKGDFSVAILDGLKHYNIIELTDSIIELLEVYNGESPYQSIYDWLRTNGVSFIKDYSKEEQLKFENDSDLH